MKPAQKPGTIIARVRERADRVAKLRVERWRFQIAHEDFMQRSDYLLQQQNTWISQAKHPEPPPAPWWRRWL